MKKTTTKKKTSTKSNLKKITPEEKIQIVKDLFKARQITKLEYYEQVCIILREHNNG